MTVESIDTSRNILWTLFGALGAIIFYSRFYVQWIVSEFHKRSVIPIAFWYMSSIGSLMLLAYAVIVQSPLGALGQCLNIVIYSRNLVHIWRENDILNRRKSVVFHTIVGIVAAVGLGLVVLTWWREFAINQEAASASARQTWFWLALGLVGQALFGCRFLLQWLVTEIKRKSVIPTAFWYLSIFAAMLQAGCFLQRREWIFAVGMAATILIYVRNLWMIHRAGNDLLKFEG